MTISTMPRYRLTLLDKINVCLTDFGDHVMHLVIKVSNPVDNERLARAVRLSMIRVPIMAQKLGWDKGNPYWTPWPESVLDAYEFTSEETLPNEETETAVHKFLLHQIDYDKEPMVHARILRVPSGEDVICVKVSCVPADGRGGLIYLEQVFAIYNELAFNPNYMPPRGSMEGRSTMGILPKLRWLDAPVLLIKSLMNQAQDTLTANNWSIPVQPAKEYDKAYILREFAPESLALITRYRKAKGYTFNDVMTAGYYKALHNWIKPEGEGPFCMLSTFDLRRYEIDTGPDRVANYSSFVNVNVKMNADTPLDTIIQRVAAAMKVRKNRYPGITEAPYIWPIMTLLPFQLARKVVMIMLKRRGEKIPVFTNLGAIDLNTIIFDGKPCLGAHAYAPLEYPPKLTTMIFTEGDRICLTLGYSKSHTPESEIKALFKSVEDILVAHCQENLQ